MIVLAGSHRSLIFQSWAKEYGNLGNLCSPDFKNKRIKLPDPFVPCAIDNGKFPCWEKGYQWDAELFLHHCDRACERVTPLWIVVPDFPTEKERTIESYYRWEPVLRRRFGVPLAFAVQDGMNPEDVPLSADVIFVGGSTQWKVETFPLWCDRFRRVHVARVNGWERLWLSHFSGAESCDGTGWFKKGPDGECAVELHLFARWQAGLLPEARELRGWPWVNPQTRKGLLRKSLQGWTLADEPLFASLSC